MSNYYDFINIVSDILENEKFKKLKLNRHHGITRFEHSYRVAYYSYLICRKIGLDYVSTARGGLLHDFFINEDLSTIKQKLSMFFHPYASIENAKNYFNINRKEEDIIINHMFPTLPHKIPKYLESWIVSLVDKTVATYEFYCSYGRKYVYRLSNIYILMILFKL